MIPYTVTDPEFSESILITEPEDREHADNINEAPKQLIENDLALKKQMDEFEDDGKLPNPHALKLNGQDAYDGSKEVWWKIRGNDYIDVENVETMPSGEKKLVIEAKVKNNTETEETGYMLDARQGKILNDKVAENRKLMARYGAKNILNVTLEGITTSGMTITVNRDSDGVVRSVKANGTASMAVSLLLGTVDDYTGSLWLSGCPAGGGTDYKLTIKENLGPGIPSESETDSGQGVAWDYGGGSNIEVWLYIRRGYTANNLIFCPMVRDADDSDGTYGPYARSNAVLTNQLDNLKNDFLNATNGLSFDVTNDGILRVTYDDGN